MESDVEMGDFPLVVADDEEAVELSAKDVGTVKKSMAEIAER